jgi:hypothetical protein
LGNGGYVHEAQEVKVIKKKPCIGVKRTSRVANRPSDCRENSDQQALVMMTGLVIVPYVGGAVLHALFVPFIRRGYAYPSGQAMAER